MFAGHLPAEIAWQMDKVHELSYPLPVAGSCTSIQRMPYPAESFPASACGQWILTHEDRSCSLLHMLSQKHHNLFPFLYPL